MWIGEWKRSSLKEIPLLMDGIKDIIMKKEENCNEDEGDDMTRAESKVCLVHR